MEIRNAFKKSFYSSVIREVLLHLMVYFILNGCSNRYSIGICRGTETNFEKGLGLRREKRVL